MRTNQRQMRGWTFRIAVVVTVVFVLLIILSFYMTQRVLLHNAQELGSELANRYAQEETSVIQTSQDLLTMGGNFLDDQMQVNTEQEDVNQWVQSFFQTIDTVAETDAVVPQAVVRGTMIDADESHPATQEELDQLPWYQQAVEQAGQIIHTDAYQHPETKQWVITIAKADTEARYVLALDLYLENISRETLTDALPKGSFYYLCDAKGTLLYVKPNTEIPYQELQQYIRTLYQQIQDGSLDGAMEYTYDMVGTKQAVYFTQSDNGWLSVITIPYAALFGNLRRYFFLIMALCGGVLLTLLFMSLRERRLQKGMARIRETAAALGNQYYAIYRVNWSRDTYESVKSSDYIRQRLPEKGSYEQLLNAIGEVIEQDTFLQFKANFSLENIRRLVEEEVSNFGGDFRRLFGQKYRWVNVRLLFDPALQPNEAILCFRQIGREKLRQIQQMQALEHALDRAKESEATQERFFSQMSHDMRTPLNVISGTVQLAKQRSKEGKDLTPYLDKIQIATEQLLTLINDILEISRMKKTGLQLKPVRCDLEETIRESISVFQTQAEIQKKNLSLTLALTQPQVIVDAFRLQQVLNNLVSNALKFTEAGDEIRVVVSQNRSVCTMTVQDTGAGISEEFLPHLFTPYARESRFEGDSVPGTGLGLSIVQEIITCMGGQIQVESKSGEGTTFTMTIPMEPAPEIPAAPAEKEDDSLLEVLRDRHLLLAEDFEMNLEVATELLTLCGAKVTQARNGKEAVDLFQASPPGTFDAILMDMNMPVMDGCAAAAAIRALDRPDAATLPILAVTANTFAEDAAAAARAGMNAHIPKPIDMRQLARALKQQGDI